MIELCRPQKLGRAESSFRIGLFSVHAGAPNSGRDVRRRGKLTDSANDCDIRCTRSLIVFPPARTRTHARPHASFARQSRAHMIRPTASHSHLRKQGLRKEGGMRPLRVIAAFIAHTTAHTPVPFAPILLLIRAHANRAYEKENAMRPVRVIAAFIAHTTRFVSRSLLSVISPARTPARTHHRSHARPPRCTAHSRTRKQGLRERARDEAAAGDCSHGHVIGGRQRRRPGRRNGRLDEVLLFVCVCAPIPCLPSLRHFPFCTRIGEIA